MLVEHMSQWSLRWWKRHVPASSKWPEMIPQMEVTFSALKRSQKWVLSRGHDLKNLLKFVLLVLVFSCRVIQRIDVMMLAYHGRFSRFTGSMSLSCPIACDDIRWPNWGDHPQKPIHVNVNLWRQPRIKAVFGQRTYRRSHHKPMLGCSLCPFSRKSETSAGFCFCESKTQSCTVGLKRNHK